MILKHRNDSHRLSLVVLLTRLLLIAAVTTSSTAQAQPDIPTLVLNQPIERELAGGQAHAYQIMLTTGYFLSVVVEQKGIDMVVRLFAPDGKQLLEIDSPNGAQGPEPLAWIAALDGAYRLEVRSLEKDAKAGRYEAKLIELRTATANDRAQIEKALALSEATQLDAEASTLGEAGQYDKALPLAERALTIYEKILGPEHRLTATLLNNIGELYRAQGQYTQAESPLKRALAIVEKVLGAEHPDTAAALHNLAALYDDKGDYAQAELLYKRALAIREKEFGAEHLATANSLHNLAALYNKKGDYAQAEPLLKRALAIREKALGAEHPKTAISLNSLAVLYSHKGNYTQAEPLMKRALAIVEKVLGAEHPDTALSLHNLAWLYYNKGDVAQAITFRSRASAVEERNIALNTQTGSERQKAVYLATLTSRSEATISLHARSAPDNPAARDLALTIILQRKGRALDAMTDSIAALRRQANPQEQALLDQLQKAQSQHAKLVLNGPQKMTPAEHQAGIKTAEEQVERLEAEVSSRSSAFRAQSQAVTLAAVQSAIPAEATLIEFFSYHPSEAKVSQLGAPRYIAYVLRQQGEAQWIELGEAKAIDAAVTELRQALRDKARTDVKPLARNVDRLVMQPVRPLLGKTRRVLISPDGLLNLIPFAALVDEHNQ